MNGLSTGQLLKQVSDQVEKYANNQLRGSGLTMSQCWVLMCLGKAERGILPLKTIEHGLSVAQPTCQGLVQRLEKKGLVKTFVNDEDRRVKLVSITETGLEAARAAEENVQKLQEFTLSGLTEDERLLFHNLLTKVYVNIRG